MLYICLIIYLNKTIKLIKSQLKSNQMKTTIFTKILGTVVIPSTMFISNVTAQLSNDSCSNAIVLTPYDSCNYVSGTNIGAKKSTSPMSCNGMNGTTAFYDVWYKFTATQSTFHYIFVQCGSGFDGVVEVFNSCWGSTVGCSNSTMTGGLELISLTNLTMGNEYYIRIYGLNETGGNFQVCVSLSTIITGMEDMETANNPSLYPNPMNDKATIDIPNYKNNYLSLSLYNSQGKQVKEFLINSKSTVISRENLNSGLYYYQLKDEKKGIRSGRLMIN
jgi:hypothetical protein